ncbi:hypothetical protein BpHYR1_050651 [Brachionus plicatilis]|uniref:Uncharacterized protein n=1 Tax=Brachionus plicatilis TaxID=10195 RepID=A0A3M7QMJ4_BRAPC|nr:hypothetical protein BpHYR1_050651 [Brachionus plicatilis]
MAYFMFLLKDICFHHLILKLFSETVKTEILNEEYCLGTLKFGHVTNRFSFHKELISSDPPIIELNKIIADIPIQMNFYLQFGPSSLLTCSFTITHYEKFAVHFSHPVHANFQLYDFFEHAVLQLRIDPFLCHQPDCLICLKQETDFLKSIQPYHIHDYL